MNNIDPVSLRVRKLRKRKQWIIMGRIDDIWWMGPYDTRAEAESDMQGVLRWLEMVRKRQR